MSPPNGLLTSGFLKHDVGHDPHIIAPDPFASDDCLDVFSLVPPFPPPEPEELNTMNPSEDEPSSGLNGRLRPRRSTIPSPISIKPMIRQLDGEPSQEIQKRSSTPPKASPSKPEDQSDQPNLLPTPQLLCPYCDRKFGSKQNVSKHIRRLHFSTSKFETPIFCLFCNHVELELTDIIRHMVDNHPNQYFACLDCHTRFPSTKELAEHKLNICARQKIPFCNKLRRKTTKKSQKSYDSNDKDTYVGKNYTGHGFNGIVISCELKPSHVNDEADIEDKITTNLILPPNKNLSSSTVLEKNAVIVLDDIQWNRRIPSNFSFHNSDADQILSRLGVVHKSPRTGDTTKKGWFRAIEDATQKFEKCFDTSFYSKVASNVQENLTKFLDGSFNFNPDPDNSIKTRKSKNSVVINTAEGFPILLAREQYSRNSFDSYLPRFLAPKHKWKWDSLEIEKPWNCDQIKKDTHANNCIISLVSSLDIWTQLCMRRKFEDKYNITPVGKKAEKQNVIGKQLKEILESREIPSTNAQIVTYLSNPLPITNEQNFPTLLGLVPSAAELNLKPAILSGEWVRPRCYVCCACGAQSRDSRTLSLHVSSHHPHAQVQHYEIVGESLLKADIFQHLYVPPNHYVNRTRPTRGIKDCTKCNKSIDIEELHQHMLDCAGDTPAVRRRCRYRPFGVRRRRPRLPDNRIRKKMRNDICTQPTLQNNRMRPKSKLRGDVGDAETIRKMLADLPAKRHRVLVKPLNSILRPRRKLDKQRAMLMLKHRSSEDPKGGKLKISNNPIHYNHSINIDRYKGRTSRDDEDNMPLKPRLSCMSSKIIRQKKSVNRKTILEGPKRKVSSAPDEKEPDDSEEENTISGPENIQNNELSMDHNELSMDHNELSMDHNELSMDHNELSMDHNELSMDHIELSMDHNELSMDHNELSMDHNELSMDHDELSMDHNELSMDHNELSLDHNELSMDHNEQRIDLNSDPQNIREHSDRGEGNNGQRGNEEAGPDGQNDNNAPEDCPPPPCVPLKHSIARLTASSETHDKGVQFHQLFLIRQQFNNANKHVPSGTKMFFENETVSSRLDKPPLLYDKIVGIDPVQGHNEDITQYQNSESIQDHDSSNQNLDSSQKNKLNKPRKGLNDCIAMLKNKLVVTDTNAPAHVSVQCGTDDPLTPETLLLSTASMITPRPDVHMETLPTPLCIERPKKSSSKSIVRNEQLVRPSPMYRGQNYNYDFHGNINNERQMTQWRPINYEVAMPRFIENHPRKETSRRRTSSHHENIFLAQQLLSMTPPHDDMLLKYSSEPYDAYNLLPRTSPQNYPEHYGHVVGNNMMNRIGNYNTYDKSYAQASKAGIQPSSSLPQSYGRIVNNYTEKNKRSLDTNKKITKTRVSVPKKPVEILENNINIRKETPKSTRDTGEKYRKKTIDCRPYLDILAKNSEERKNDSYPPMIAPITSKKRSSNVNTETPSLPFKPVERQLKRDANLKMPLKVYGEHNFNTNQIVIPPAHASNNVPSILPVPLDLSGKAVDPQYSLRGNLLASSYNTYETLDLSKTAIEHQIEDEVVDLRIKHTPQYRVQNTLKPTSFVSVQQQMNTIPQLNLIHQNEIVPTDLSLKRKDEDNNKCINLSQRKDPEDTKIQIQDLSKHMFQTASIEYRLHIDDKSPSDLSNRNIRNIETITSTSKEFNKTNTSENITTCDLRNEAVRRNSFFEKSNAGNLDSVNTQILTADNQMMVESDAQLDDNINKFDKRQEPIQVVSLNSSTEAQKVTYDPTVRQETTQTEVSLKSSSDTQNQKRIYDPTLRPDIIQAEVSYSSPVTQKVIYERNLLQEIIQTEVSLKSASETLSPIHNLTLRDEKIQTEGSLNSSSDIKKLICDSNLRQETIPKEVPLKSLSDSRKSVYDPTLREETLRTKVSLNSSSNAQKPINETLREETLRTKVSLNSSSNAQKPINETLREETLRTKVSLNSSSNAQNSIYAPTLREETLRTKVSLNFSSETQKPIYDPTLREETLRTKVSLKSSSDAQKPIYDPTLREETLRTKVSFNSSSDAQKPIYDPRLREEILRTKVSLNSSSNAQKPIYGRTLREETLRTKVSVNSSSNAQKPMYDTTLREETLRSKVSLNSSSNAQKPINETLREETLRTKVSLNSSSNAQNSIYDPTLREETLRTKVSLNSSSEAQKPVYDPTLREETLRTKVSLKSSSDAQKPIYDRTLREKALRTKVPLNSSSGAQKSIYDPTLRKETLRTKVTLNSSPDNQKPIYDPTLREETLRTKVSLNSSPDNQKPIYDPTLREETLRTKVSLNSSPDNQKPIYDPTLREETLRTKVSLNSSPDNQKPIYHPTLREEALRTEVTLKSSPDNQKPICDPSLREEIIRTKVSLNFSSDAQKPIYDPTLREETLRTRTKVPLNSSSEAQKPIFDSTLPEKTLRREFSLQFSSDTQGPINDPALQQETIQTEGFSKSSSDTRKSINDHTLRQETILTEVSSKSLSDTQKPIFDPKLRQEKTEVSSKSFSDTQEPINDPDLRQETIQTEVVLNSSSDNQKPIYDPTLRIPQYKIKRAEEKSVSKENKTAVTATLAAISNYSGSYSSYPISFRSQNCTLSTNSIIASIQAQERITYSFTKSILSNAFTSSGVMQQQPEYSLLYRGITTPFTTFESTRPVYALPKTCISMARINATANSLLGIPSTAIMCTTPVYTLAGTTIVTPVNYASLPYSGQSIPYPPRSASYIMTDIDNQIITNFTSSSTTQEIRSNEDSISIKNALLCLDRNTELMKEIIMLPNDFMSVLITMSVEHRKQLVDIVTKYFSASKPIPILATQITLLNNSIPSILPTPIKDTMELSIENPIELVIENPTELAIENPTELAIENPTELAIENPTELAIENPTELAVENPTELAIENPTELAIENPTELAIENPTDADKNQLNSLRFVINKRRRSYKRNFNRSSFKLQSTGLKPEKLSLRNKAIDFKCDEIPSKTDLHNKMDDVPQLLMTEKNCTPSLPTPNIPKTNNGKTASLRAVRIKAPAERRKLKIDNQLLSLSCTEVQVLPNSLYSDSKVSQIFELKNSSDIQMFEVSSTQSNKNTVFGIDFSNRDIATCKTTCQVLSDNVVKSGDDLPIKEHCEEFVNSQLQNTPLGTQVPDDNAKGKEVVQLNDNSIIDRTSGPGTKEVCNKSTNVTIRDVQGKSFEKYNQSAVDNKDDSDDDISLAVIVKQKQQKQNNLKSLFKSNNKVIIGKRKKNKSTSTPFNQKYKNTDKRKSQKSSTVTNSNLNNLDKRDEENTLQDAFIANQNMKGSTTRSNSSSTQMKSKEVKQKGKQNLSGELLVNVVKLQDQTETETMRRGIESNKNSDNESKNVSDSSGEILELNDKQQHLTSFNSTIVSCNSEIRVQESIALNTHLKSIVNIQDKLKVSENNTIINMDNRNNVEESIGTQNIGILIQACNQEEMLQSTLPQQCTDLKALPIKPSCATDKIDAGGPYETMLIRNDDLISNTSSAEKPETRKGELNTFNQGESGMPVRRSGRGKSLVFDGNGQGALPSETPIEPRAPLTKKQLIFSKLLLDEENNTKKMASVAVNPQILGDNNACQIFHPVKVPLEEKSKLVKRKNSPVPKAKSKKKKSVDVFQPINSEDEIHKAFAANTSPKNNRDADVQYINPNLHFNRALDLRNNLSQPNNNDCNELSSKSIKVVDENQEVKPGNSIKRKIPLSTNNNFESVHISEPKKLKLNNLTDINAVADLAVTAVDISNRNFPNINVPLAVRRTRSKSVIVQSSGSMLYDPYDIDLEDMGDKTEPFRKQNKFWMCATKENDSKTPPVNISHAISTESIAAEKSKETISDSDESSKSDVPLMKYVEEKERKKLLLSENVNTKEINVEAETNGNDIKRSKRKQKKNKRTLTSIDNIQKEDKDAKEISEEQLRSEQFMESFGFFSERKPRKSNLLATKKISETFHIIANESEDYWDTKGRASKKSARSENKRNVEENNEEALVKTDDFSKVPIKWDKNLKLRAATRYCHICKKEFRRTDNLVRHQMSLQHLIKVSESGSEPITPIPEDPNYLVIYKQHMDRLNLLEYEMKKKNDSNVKFIFPSLQEILIEVEKTVREQQLARTNLSRDQALFLDCCELLKDSNRGQISNRSLLSENEPCCASSYALANVSPKEYNPNSGISIYYHRYNKSIPNLSKKPIIHTSARLSGMADFVLAPSASKKAKAKTDRYSLPSTSSSGLNRSDFINQDKLPMIGVIADEKYDSKSDGDVDSITAQNILDSEEVRNLENDLISGLKEAACKFQPLLSRDKISTNLSDNLANITGAQDSKCPQVCIEESAEKETVSKVKNTSDSKERKNLDICENIDIFEDKFDKIKRKCRSQAAAAKLAQIPVEPTVSHRSRKKSEKKKVKRNPKKCNQNSVPTKGALKGYDSIKVSISTSDINMSAIIPPVTNSSKKKKRSSSKKKRDKKKSVLPRNIDSKAKNINKNIDVYEFSDNEEPEVFKLRPSTVMERFRNLKNKVTQFSNKVETNHKKVESSDSASDGDDFVYMSDDYVCSDDETENSLLSCELGIVKGSHEVKKSFSPLKRKDVMEKNAVMGKIFKFNAVRSEKKSKPKETEKPKANLDQLFDSLLEEKPNLSGPISNSESPKISPTCMPQKKRVFSPIMLSQYDSKIPDNNDFSLKTLRSSTPTISSDGEESKKIGSLSSQMSPPKRSASNRLETASQHNYLPATSKEQEERKDYELSLKDSKDMICEKKNDRKIEIIEDSISSTKSDELLLKACVKPNKDRTLSKKKDKLLEIESAYDFKDDYDDENALSDDAGVARQRARRKCTVGKQNVLAETWSSESEPDGVPPRPNSAESVVIGAARKRKGKKREGNINGGRKSNKHVSVKKQDFESRVTSSNRNSGMSTGAAGTSRPSGSSCVYSPHFALPGPSGIGPRLRPTTSYWADDDEEPEHVQQHGWIVGDSHKKLVTMLAHAKGRKRNNDDNRHFME